MLSSPEGGKVIIDFRVRPPFGGYLRGHVFRDRERTASMSRAQGHEPAPSLLEASWDLFRAEMDAAGIDVAVVPGRWADPRYGEVPNEDIAQLVRLGGGRFVGFAAVDVRAPNAAAELERAVRELGLIGLALDPGFAHQPFYADDPIALPLYERCHRLGVPLMLTVSGNAGPDISYADPLRVDRIAAAYPDLQIIVAHGGWPRVLEMLGVAFRRPNVWLSPDQYAVNMPGALHWVEAANSFLRDRLLFGSSYPFLPLAGALASYRALPFRPDVLDAVLGGNAQRLLDMVQTRRR